MDIKLLSGLIVKESAEKYQSYIALQDIAEVDYACEICPIRTPCGDNNQFDCQVYGMFSGFCDDNINTDPTEYLKEYVEKCD